MRNPASTKRQSASTEPTKEDLETRAELSETKIGKDRFSRPEKQVKALQIETKERSISVSSKTKERSCNLRKGDTIVGSGANVKKSKGNGANLSRTPAPSERRQEGKRRAGGVAHHKGNPKSEEASVFDSRHKGCTQEENR